MLDSGEASRETRSCFDPSAGMTLLVWPSFPRKVQRLSCRTFVHRLPTPSSELGGWGHAAIRCGHRMPGIRKDVPTGRTMCWSRTTDSSSDESRSDCGSGPSMGRCEPLPAIVAVQLKFEGWPKVFRRSRR
jgi:hypothetical protein